MSLALAMPENRSMAKSDNFYVYLYRNPLKGGEPFYVGKGRGKRAQDHIREARWNKPGPRANRHKINTIRAITAAGAAPSIQLVDSGLTEDRAFELEMLLISMIGRADRGRGPLTNLSDGGEGVQGVDMSGEKNPNYGKRGEAAHWWGRKHDEATKEKIASAQRGRLFSEEHIAAMRKPKSEAGRKAIAEARKNSTYRPSEETRALLSQALKGRPSPMKGRQHADESRAKLSAAQRGKPKPKHACPHCGKVGAMNVMKRWHFENCKEKP